MFHEVCWLFSYLPEGKEEEREKPQCRYPVTQLMFELLVATTPFTWI
jgi:hypothetical protein